MIAAFQNVDGKPTLLFVLNWHDDAQTMFVDTFSGWMCGIAIGVVSVSFIE